MITRLALLSLLLAPTVGSGDHSRNDFPNCSDAIQSLDLATLSLDQARHLAGKRGRFQIVRDSKGWPYRTGMLYECLTDDDVSRSVTLPDDSFDDGVSEMDVDGVLTILEHKPSVGADGTMFEGFTEIRVEDGRPVR